MATMKPLNVISTEQLSANREAKNSVLTESDGQAFAQTLRQQMQQETNLKAQRDTEDRLETQSALSKQQTERARLAMQSNQVKSTQVNNSSQATKPEQATKVAQATSPAQNKAIQNRAMQANTDTKETDINKAQLSVNDETAVALTDPLQTMAEMSATTQTEDTVAEQDVKQAGVDDNTIANMGWLASMMAMRDNQALSANKPVTADAESTLASGVLSSDSALLTTQMAQADGLLDKTAQHAGEGNTPFDHLLSMQANSAANNTATNDVQDLAFGKAIGSEHELASFAKENLVDNGSLISQPALVDNQAAGITKASEQLTTNTTDNMQSVINAQATAAFNTANASMVSEPQMITAQVNVPFGIKGWQEAMNKQVMQMTQQGNELATLTLSPPDLGPVQVVLRVDNQSVDAAFVSDNANVRQALEDGLQDLKESMASQGLQLGNTFVGNGNQAQQHFDAQAQPSQERFTQLKETVKESVATPVRAVPVGLVDTFV